MVKIRLKRGGAKKRPHYRVIAIDERVQRDGRALEYLGHYDPIREPAAIQLEHERIAHWVGQGAQLSHAVKALLRRARRRAAAAPPEPPAPPEEAPAPAQAEPVQAELAEAAPAPAPAAEGGES
ncbi:MAG: 30S ribosomal protein S16 [Deltaproteobacteria bacterium]|nr:30S ribosomal protein S16 [Deltaproteobacteria bacterium]